jgi:hypothetical protein
MQVDWKGVETMAMEQMASASRGVVGVGSRGCGGGGGGGSSSSGGGGSSAFSAVFFLKFNSCFQVRELSASAHVASLSSPF